MRRAFRDDEHEAAFVREGFVVVDLLDARDLVRLRAIWDVCDDPIKTGAFSTSIMSGNVAYREDVHREVTAVLEPRVSALLDDYRICLGSFMTKPGNGDVRSTVDLHQDWTFVDESRYRSVAFWCPLVDVDESNGCLRVVPGSHRVSAQPRIPFEPFRYQALAGCLEQHFLVSVPLKAGQAIVFTQALMHASQPNFSRDIRVVAGALAIPRESTLLYVSRHGSDSWLGLHEVDDSFYRTLPFGPVRIDAPPVRTVQLVEESPTEEQLHARLTAV